MDYVGIDAVEFGANADEMQRARSLFTDWGLARVSSGTRATTFATGLGSRVIVRAESSSRGLRPRIAADSQFREVIFGVEKPAQLKAIATELARDREVTVDQDATLHTVDDSGINIGFRVWQHGREKPGAGTTWNGPGHRGRVDRISPVYHGAQPFKMGHIVFFVPDTRVAEKFYRERLGFWLSDRYVGGAGVFLRWARKSEHHNLFFVKSRTGNTALHHIAFEVRDVHEVFGGGLEFAKRGYTTEVGPGRHPISSAYFWYFKNPLGGAIEYFCDPDHVTERWTPHNYRVNRFSEWHLNEGIKLVDDGKIRPSLKAAKAIAKPAMAAS